MTEKEIIEEAKRRYKTANAEQKYLLECLLPELFVSEDERIKREIVRFINLHKNDERKRDEWIAWLKKQEGKPTLRERYENIAKSEWFKRTHDGMSCGMITPEESLGISSDEYNEVVSDCIMSESKATHHEGWVNIFKCGLCYSVWGNIYPTKEDALDDIEGDEGDVYITTIKIEWEE